MLRTVLIHLNIAVVKIRLVKEIAPVEVKGKFRNSTRMRALREIENAISCAAVAGAAMQDIPPQLFFNTDEVSLFLSDTMTEKPKVLTTKAIQKLLRKRNLSEGVKHEQQQRRVVTLHITTNGIGKVRIMQLLLYICDFIHLTKPSVVQTVHVMVKIVDRNFERLRVFSVTKTLSVWFVPVGEDGTDMVTEGHKRFVLDQIEEERRSYQDAVDDDQEEDLFSYHARNLDFNEQVWNACIVY